ncbi:MAG: rhodanese-like domain-containing protein [Deltaproteobacteria bacterium]|nr:rhodanese-like domain-containing protein [Deltaproteobacteria bacterium]MBW2070897.1 rhodanese-like domain-containing protein [Deltaproteobacteria bacterium]
MAVADRPPTPWLRASWQALLLVVLATAVALLTNQLRSDQLPLVADWSPAARLLDEAGDSLIISLDEAIALFDTQEALFLDARPPDVYELGHILGARNLPWEDFETYYQRVMKDVPQEAQIITYCDGEGCSLSKELALALIANGYQNVRVLVNGWSHWQEQQLPVDMGSLSGSP